MDTMNIDSPSIPDKFPMRAREGTNVRTGYMGSVQYKLVSFVYEEYNPSLHDMTGVFHALRVDVNSNEEVECTVKIRMQLNPAFASYKYGHFSYLDHRSPDIKEESRALRACAFSGRTPKFLDCAAEVQDHTGFFPGGYLHVLATRKFAGQPLSRLLGCLTEDDLQVIKQDLVITLNHMRNVGYILHSEAATLSLNAANPQLVAKKPLLKIDERHVWYDSSSQTVYLFDLSCFRGRPYRPYHYYDYFAGSYNYTPQPTTEEALTRSQFWERLVASQAARVANQVAKQRVFQLCLRNRADALRNDGWQMVDAN